MYTFVGKSFNLKTPNEYENKITYYYVNSLRSIFS